MGLAPASIDFRDRRLSGGLWKSRDTGAAHYRFSESGYGRASYTVFGPGSELWASPLSVSGAWGSVWEYGIGWSWRAADKDRRWYSHGVLSDPDPRFRLSPNLFTCLGFRKVLTTSAF